MKKKNGFIAAAAGILVTAFVAAPAAAQVCAGQPTAPGQTSIGARASFPTGATSVGVEAGRNWNNPMGAFVNLNLLMPDADGADNVAVVGAGLAYEVGGSAVPAWLSICPVAGVTIGFQDNTVVTIPVGVGFGSRFGTPDGFEILPFVIPQFVLTRISEDGVSSSNNNFGIGVGSFAKFSGVYGGVTLNRVFADNATNDVTIHGGLVFPARLR
ncbi:hypothetical protein BH23GEM9_BH23GEM9_35750 [soil metagenome]